MPKKTVQVQIVDPDYSELEVLDLLSRPNEEAPNCVGLGGIDHMINIHYPVVVDGKTHQVRAHVFITECDECGACPTEEQHALHSCLTCCPDSDEFGHETDGLVILKEYCESLPDDKTNGHHGKSKWLPRRES